MALQRSLALPVLLLLVASAQLSQARRIVMKKESDVDQAPAICSKKVVNAVCALLNGGEGSNSIHQDALMSTLSASGRGSTEFWLQMTSENHISCMDLCKKVHAYLQDKATIPPTSDVGCYLDVDGSTRCDLDLSPVTVESFVSPSKDLPDFEDGNDEDGIITEPLHDQPEATHIDALSEPSYIKYSEVELACEVANLFRFYPRLAGGVLTGQDAAQGSSMLQASKGEAWRSTVDKVSQEASAYLTTAIRLFEAKNTREAITTWFGKHAYGDAKTRKEVQRILNSVKTMINHVAYHYDRKCKSNVFAYVYPNLGKCAGIVPNEGEKCTLNSQNKYVFYLCDLFFDSKLDTQIETILHEGSHHASSFTKDVCMEEFYPGAEKVQYVTVPVLWDPAHGPKIGKKDAKLGEIVWVPSGDVKFGDNINVIGKEAMGRVWSIDTAAKTAVVQLYFKTGKNPCSPPGHEKAYGQNTCADLARLDPQKALRNADNFCYYITHTVTHKSGVDPPTKYEGYVVGDTVVSRGRKGVVQYQEFAVGSKVLVYSTHSNKFQPAIVTKSRPFMAIPSWLTNSSLNEYPEGFSYSKVKPDGPMKDLTVRFENTQTAVQVPIRDLKAV